jgi:hypothetical protein
MAKTEVQKRAEVMKKEWWKSRATESSINDLVGMGLLHNKALRGWRALDLESFPDPQPGEIVVFEDFFKRGFGFLFILSSKGCVCTMRLGFSICIPTQFFSFPPPFTSTKLLVGLLRISIFLLSILSAEEGVKGGISDHR